MTFSKSIYLLFLASLLLFNWGCKKNDTEPSLSAAEQLAVDITIIEDYLISKNLTASKTASGLHYIVLEEGTENTKPSPTTKVEVQYKGYFTNGSVFDQTSGSATIRFNLNQVITGWQEGLLLMNKGQKNTLLIPSALGYGSNPPQGIPKNAVLIFDVKLVDF
jgi:FKBP-type peptidyl-prolyl cis-trans isomerase FkpA